MRTINKVKHLLTVLATTTALSTGFAVEWKDLPPGTQKAVKAEYDKFRPGFTLNPVKAVSSLDYKIEHLKGMLEILIGQNLTPQEFIDFLKGLGYDNSGNIQAYLDNFKNESSAPKIISTSEINKIKGLGDKLVADYKKFKDKASYKLGHLKGMWEIQIGRNLTPEEFVLLLIAANNSFKDQPTLKNTKDTRAEYLSHFPKAVQVQEPPKEEKLDAKPPEEENPSSVGSSAVESEAPPTEVPPGVDPLLETAPKKESLPRVPMDPKSKAGKKVEEDHYSEMPSGPKRLTNEQIEARMEQIIERMESSGIEITIEKVREELGKEGIETKQDAILFKKIMERRAAALKSKTLPSNPFVDLEPFPPKSETVGMPEVSKSKTLSDVPPSISPRLPEKDDPKLNPPPSYEQATRDIPPPPSDTPPPYTPREGEHLHTPTKERSATSPSGEGIYERLGVAGPPEASMGSLPVMKHSEESLAESTGSKSSEAEALRHGYVKEEDERRARETLGRVDVSKAYVAEKRADSYMRQQDQMIAGKAKTLSDPKNMSAEGKRQYDALVKVGKGAPISPALWVQFFGSVPTEATKIDAERRLKIFRRAAEMETSKLSNREDAMKGVDAFLEELFKIKGPGIRDETEKQERIEREKFDSSVKKFSSYKNWSSVGKTQYQELVNLGDVKKAITPATWQLLGLNPQPNNPQSLLDAAARLAVFRDAITIGKDFPNNTERALEGIRKLLEEVSQSLSPSTSYESLPSEQSEGFSPPQAPSEEMRKYQGVQATTEERQPLLEGEEEINLN